MKDKTHFWFGMCRFKVECTLEDLINRASAFGIQLYQVSSDAQYLSFFCPFDMKKKVKTAFPDAVLDKTTGLLGFVAAEAKRPFHWVLLIWMIFLYGMLNHTILSIEWQSTSTSLRNEMEAYLSAEGISRGYFVKEIQFDELIKKQLKQKFIHELSWIEVNRSGSLLKISFNHKESVEPKTFQSIPLVSTKHAMVVRFELLHGMKQVSKYQIVAPGDVLVESYLIDSSGKRQDLYVEGKVFGMTWYTVSSELEGNEKMSVLDFLRLLYECRLQIEKEIDQDEQILKENILQAAASEGKIRMVIHYTCLEDITKQ